MKKVAVLISLVLSLASVGEPRGESPVRADRHGDALPAGALARLGTIRLRHGGPVSFVGFLPDGKTLVSAGQDQAVRLWDVKTGKELRRLDLAGPARVILSADGKVLVTRRSDGVVQVWNPATGKELLPPRGEKKALSLPPCGLSPDGKTLAALVQDGTIDLWDLASRRKVRSLKGGRPFNGRRFLLDDAAVFSPDGKTLVTVGADLADTSADRGLVLQVWDVAAGKRRHCLERPLALTPASLPSFSPDGKLLAWGDGSRLTVLDVTTGKEVRRLTSLAWMPCADDADPVTPGKEVRRLTSRSARPHDVVFSPDGKTLYGRGRTEGVIVAWDVASGKELRVLAGPRSRSPGPHTQAALRRLLAVSPDGKMLACSGERTAICLLDTRTGKETLALPGHRGAVHFLSCGRDGKTLTTQSEDGTARVWDVRKGAETQRLQAPAGILDWQLLPDGKTLVGEGPDHTVRLWDAATGKERRRLAEGRGIAQAHFTFAPNNKLLAVRGYPDTTIRLCEIGTGKEVKTFAPAPRLPPKASPVSPFVPLARPAFSPDGKLLAAPTEDDAVVVWDSASGRELRSIALPKYKTVVWLTFAPDGRSLLLYLGEGNVALWEIATGKRRRLYGESPKKDETAEESMRRLLTRMMYALNPSAAPTVAFSPDGRTLALAADDKVRIWDVRTGKERGRFSGHQGRVRALAFAPDGRTLTTAGADGTALIWDVAGLGGAARNKELSERELAGYWADLTGDAGKAYEAICALTLAPGQAVPLLRQRLPPVSVKAGQLERLIADLDSRRFAVRDKARIELERLGARAAPALRQALAGRPSLEVRRRLEDLLEKATSAEQSRGRLRLLRAIEVLEGVGTPEAVAVLRALAKGLPGEPETVEARAALDRLGK